MYIHRQVKVILYTCLYAKVHIFLCCIFPRIRKQFSTVQIHRQVKVMYSTYVYMYRYTYFSILFITFLHRAGPSAGELNIHLSIRTSMYIYFSIEFFPRIWKHFSTVQIHRQVKEKYSTYVHTVCQYVQVHIFLYCLLQLWIIFSFSHDVTKITFVLFLPPPPQKLRVPSSCPPHPPTLRISKCWNLKHKP